MSIQLISISHKKTPLEIRRLFAFSKEQKIQLMKSLIEEGKADESIVIATCNRTEIYFYTGDHTKDNDVRKAAKQLILKAADAEEVPHISDYLLFYSGKKAVHHLFHVATGLDSAVIGEDQILGQVKDAHVDAREAGTAGKYLNTLFRYAVTGAKKVKTDTDLSRTSVSTATLAIKAGEDVFGTLDGKTVMVIGGSGQIGSIVMKNLYTMKGVHIISTVRNVQLTHDSHAKNASTVFIDYKERFDHMDACDVVISATSSPHYTITYSNAKERLITPKERVFVDLAVPVDIEQSIAEIEGMHLFNMDDMTRLAAENNKAKEQAAIEAGDILDEAEEDFLRWLVFQENAATFTEIKDWMVDIAEKKSFEKAIEKLFYNFREQSSPEDLQIFFDTLKGMER